jgi:hypothetical protein
MKPFKVLFLSILATTLLFTSCDNDDDEPQIEDGTVNMMFEYKVGDEPLDMTKVYEINGTAVRFDLANFYVGGITFKPEHGDDAEPVTVDGKYLLVTPDAGAQQVTDLPAGHWHEVAFHVGVDATTNSQTEEDFTSRSSDDPLALQDPPMHWNWNAGYRFVRIDGAVDTDGDGTPETDMAFHLGTDQMFTNLEYTIHKDIEEGDNMIHFIFDLEKAFEGIDLSTQFTTHTNNNIDLAKQLQNNLSAAIAPAHG